MHDNLPHGGALRKFLAWSAGERGATILTAAIIVLTGLSGFCLGRLSIARGGQAGLSIKAVPLQASREDAAAQATATVAGGQVVASKSGTKYHFPWCAGARAISEANKIWFDSPEDARKAGYLPASNCKGLQ